MQQGGWDMWLLLLISIVGVAVVIERMVFFQTQHGDTKGLLRQIGTKVSADDLDGAIAICKKSRGMLPRILEFGLRRGEKNRADITDALSIALMEHLNSLERNLPIIGTIAVIAPFVGLFGTVLGIIRAFQELGMQGSASLRAVGPGIADALIATAVGLAAAIPAAIFYNHFGNSIRELGARMDDFSLEFLNMAERSFGE
jgi:biopolymer transport protein ExbB/TolQ